MKVIWSSQATFAWQQDGENIIIDLFWDTRMNPTTLIKRLQGNS